MSLLLIKNPVFKIKFDGQLAQVDANVLINSLLHTTNMIQEINRYLDTGKKIEIKVKALEKGSFSICLELMDSTTLEQIKTLFTTDNLSLTADIITILVGIISVKKFLKGKKEKDIIRDDTKTTITNIDGEQQVFINPVINIYNNNPIVKDALAQNFETLNNDPSIDAFEITDFDDNPYIIVEKDEFNNMSLKSEDISEDERIITEAATLTIVRLSFEETLKWDFYNRGIKITAKINDPQFFELIDRGESFATGDNLEVELQTTQKLDPIVKAWVNKSYKVTRIYRHIKQGEQSKFDFDDTNKI